MWWTRPWGRKFRSRANGLSPMRWRRGNGSFRGNSNIPSGVDGSRVGEIGPSVVREREQLAQDGVVLISLVLDRKGKLHEEPEIISRGFVYKHDEDDLIEQTRKKVRRTKNKVRRTRIKV